MAKTELSNWRTFARAVSSCFALAFSLSALGQANPTVTPALKVSGKIIARSGQTIRGYQISNPHGPCVIVQNVNHVTIEGNQIGPCGSDPQWQIGIYINQSSDLQILNNQFAKVSSALYAVQGSAGQLLFEGNTATEIRGPAPRGQLVQLNHYSGPQIVLRCNLSDQVLGGYRNRDGRGGPEDQINIYQSSGTPDSPIKIMHNKIRGGGSKSGGGILAVDAGEGANVVIHENILVDPGQYGIGIASGSQIQITDNQIYAAKNSWTNVGIYVWNQYPTTRCENHEISGNRINYMNQKGFSNPYWDAGNCGSIKKVKANQFQAFYLDSSIWDSPLPACKQSWRTW